MANIPYHDINTFNTGTNVILTSPNSEFSYHFAQTKETIGLDDIELIVNYGVSPEAAFKRMKY